MGWKDDPIIESSWQNDPVIDDEKKKPEQVSAGQAALISGGHWLDKKAAGLREAVGSLPMIGGPIVSALDKVDRLTGAKTPDATQYQSEVPGMAEVSRQHPVAAFAGDFLPSALTVNPLAMGMMAAVDPGTAAERAGRGAFAFGAGKAGQYVGGKVADALASRATNKAATLAADQASHATRDATVAEAQAAGYVFPPSQIAPTATNRVMEGLAGKISTAQGAAIKNEEVTKALAKKALGLPNDIPLTKETLAQVRSTAGEAYKTLRGFGPVQTDAEFKAAIDGITGEYRALVQDFPSQANGGIDALVKDFGKPQFNSSSAVDLVRRLRADGRANLKAFDDPAKQSLGKVQLGAQNAIEDLLDRNLAASGNEGFLQVFRNARTIIAKTHTVEDALEESTGKIVAGKIGKEFSKGRPLTGELATIGKTAQAFPRAVQNVNTSMPGVSPLDYMAGLMTGTASGNPLGMGAAFVRPIARSALLSDKYQKALVKAPSYDLSATDKLLARLGDDPELAKRLGGLLGLGGLRAYQ